MKDGGLQMTLAEFKALIREQFLMLLMDQEATLQAIPDLLPADEDARRKGLAALHEVLSARGDTVRGGGGSMAANYRTVRHRCGGGLSAAPEVSRPSKPDWRRHLSDEGREALKRLSRRTSFWSRLTQTKPKLLTKNTST